MPCKIVDEIWHQHILDTAAYRRDCEAIFGRFLDHYPYFGMRERGQAQELTDAYAETLDLYREAFGEPPPDTWIARRFLEMQAHGLQAAEVPLRPTRR